MYSAFDLRFKLIDFDLSVFADANGEYQRMSDSNGGTKNCISFELYNDAPYSWRTDIFGLGGSFFT